MLSGQTRYTMAEIAIALIGFSGVVTALGPRREGRWTPSERLRLRTPVEPSAFSLVGAVQKTQTP